MQPQQPDILQGLLESLRAVRPPGPPQLGPAAADARGAPPRPHPIPSAQAAGPKLGSTAETEPLQRLIDVLEEGQITDRPQPPRLSALGVIAAQLADAAVAATLQQLRMRQEEVESELLAQRAETVERQRHERKSLDAKHVLNVARTNAQADRVWARDLAALEEREQAELRECDAGILAALHDLALAQLRELERLIPVPAWQNASEAGRLELYQRLLAVCGDLAVI